MLIKKIKTFIKKPRESISYYWHSFCWRIKSICLKKFIYDRLPDKIALKLKFERVMGEQLDLKRPTTYSQKLQWLKLYDRNPIYTNLVDKYEVKKIVAQKIGQKYIVPTYGIWNRVDQIQWEKLPNLFVIKCTHDSGSTIICRDKAQLDRQSVEETLKKHLSKSQFLYGREWPYKKVKPRIIAEKLLTEGAETPIIDYKVLCFHGEPKLIEVHQGRGTDCYTQDYYDTDWNLIRISQKGYPVSLKASPKPAEIETLLTFSRLLSAEIPHVRVDWYLIGHEIYFGELTFYDGSGLCVFDHHEDDELMGSWIRLEAKKRRSKIRG